MQVPNYEPFASEGEINRGSFTTIRRETYSYETALKSLLYTLEEKFYPHLTKLSLTIEKMEESIRGELTKKEQQISELLQKLDDYKEKEIKVREERERIRIKNAVLPSPKEVDLQEKNRLLGERIKELEELELLNFEVIEGGKVELAGEKREKQILNDEITRWMNSYERLKNKNENLEKQLQDKENTQQQFFKAERELIDKKIDLSARNNELSDQITTLKKQLSSKNRQLKFAWFLNSIQGITKPTCKFLLGKTRGKVVAKYLNSSIQILSGSKLFQNFSFGYELWIVCWTLIIGFGIKLFGGLICKKLKSKKEK